MKGVFLDYASLGPTDIDISPLRNQLTELELHLASTPTQVAGRIAEAEVVIVNKVALDEATLRLAARLRLICIAATGTDNVSLQAAKALDIGICNIRDYCTPSVVQHVFALILWLTNHLREYDELVRAKIWPTRSEFCLLDFPFRELEGKTIGIIGLGTLGSAVAEVALAFGMHVIAVRRKADSDGSRIETTDLQDLLRRSDIVSLHCPLTPETENLVNADTLELMKPDAILINAARGGLVDSDALIRALRDNVIAGAGIDVLRQEPPVNPEPLLEARLPNLIVTPHIAWAAREARQRAVEEIAANIESYKGGNNRNRVI